jgi:sulfate adenylyltransferase large subunit
MAPFDERGQDGLLRFTTAGSVDDGKSTLIGRLLYDAKAVPDDQLAALERTAKRNGDGVIDLSLLTDGLTAEREQGITIDVAYRYFATPRRKFIIADTPGHEQYTRNMVTGASTADAAVILVDARKGMTDQTRRHLTLAHLLGIPHLVLAVNKMDLVGYNQEVFDTVADSVTEFVTRLNGRAPLLVPISAKQGDNVVHGSAAMPWYGGEPMLAILETLPRAIHISHTPLRFPVQLVTRAPEEGGGQRRLYLGRVESGRISVGDEVLVLPAGIATRVCAISTHDGPLDTAAAPRSIALEVTDNVDIARGDILAHPAQKPKIGKTFEATICWFSDDGFDRRGRYLIRHGTHLVSARIVELIHRFDIATQDKVAAPTTLTRNDIARVRLVLQSPLPFDAYRDNRATGAFILIDEQSNATAAAGMIEG